MADFGIKVSKPGYNIGTATTEENLTLKTDLSLLKVFASGSGTVAGGVWVQFNHNLGYIPQFQVYVEDINHSGDMILATADWNAGVARAGTASVYWQIAGAGTTSYKYYYYIFYEQI